MALAIFDDILTLSPDATFLIITRRNAGLIRDLVSAYPQITVREIPGGVRALTFFLGLLTQQWTLVAFGVALNYSFRLKLFFQALSIIPGNRTIGLDDRVTGKGWLPLQHFVPPDNEMLIIKSFRRMLPYIGGYSEAELATVQTRTPHVKLNTQLPKDFPFAKGTYIVVHLFGMAKYRSLPVRRSKVLFASIQQAYPNFPIVFTGAEKDREIAQEISNAVPNSIVCIDLPILEVAGIIDGAALYIGVDTGITHLAGVLQQKSIIISHNGDLRWTLTYNPNARILVNSKRCTCATVGWCYVLEDGEEYRRCMYDITDTFILNSVQLALSSPDRNIPNFAGRFDENTY
jgi:ADP-heptose:LPS heptosyltransferase